MRIDWTGLISEFPHGTQSGSLLVHQNVKLVFAKMALKTSRTGFVVTLHVCTAILAMTPPSFYPKMQNLCRFR